MPEVKIDPQWGVQLEGDAADISELEHLLGGSSRTITDFCLTRLEEVPVLTTMRWNSHRTPDEVKAKAEAELRLLSGCLNLLNGGGPITVGTIYRFHDDRHFDMTRLTTLTIRVKRKEGDRATPARFRQVLDLADDQAWLSSALSLLSGEHDWFTVFKVIESIESHFGSERAMVKSSLINGIELKRAKRMANSFRHLDNGAHTQPNPPMTLGQAWALLGTSIRALIPT